MDDIGVVNFAAQKNAVELRRIPRATIDADQVLVEVANVGVCGSDLHMWQATQGWPVNYPVVLGHEFAGTIVQIGDAVTGWQVGQRVVSETAAVIDPDNPMSRRGLYNLDPNRLAYGAAVDGAMRSFVPVPARIVHRVPDGLPFETAALCEPCSVAYNAVVNNSDILPGDRIAVIGPGPIGLLCAAMARLRGAQVAVVGLPDDQKRLDVARCYGCTPIIDDAHDWACAGDGLGADGVIDAAGVSATLKLALKIVRPAGWITKVGWGPQPLDFSLDPLVQKNVRLQGSFSHNWPIWQRVIDLLASGQLDIDPIIGGVWPYAQWHEAFETMHDRRIVKAVLHP